MSRLWLGVLLGLIAGAVSAAMMIPMKFPDKTTALLGAFTNRFLIGFFLGTSTLPISPMQAGALVGFLVSLPDAIITKAYAPILVFGTIFGVLIAVALQRWAI